MAKAEFLMKGKPKTAQSSVAGMYMSEKLDGVRAVWDGGVSRGIPASQVPWANTVKHDRFLVPPIATGLWTNYAQPLQAPDWFLDLMPEYPADGELWLGRGLFQSLISIVNSKVLVKDWSDVKYTIFDFPTADQLFLARTISNPIAKFAMPASGYGWAKAEAKRRKYDEWAFENRSFYGHQYNRGNVVTLPQERLSHREPEALAQMNARLSEVLDGGGEGLMLRRLSQKWVPERVSSLIKVKPFEDAEAEVIGYKYAKEGKLAGLIGSLTCRSSEGKIFNLSGLEDVQRLLDRSDLWKPGEPVEDCITAPSFPRGTVITYRYRELTDDGFPKDPRFLRRRDHA